MMTVLRPTHRVLVPVLALLCSAVPAMADVAHSYGGRFGVSYQRNPNAVPGTTVVLYEGRYSTTFTHQADNGLRFRFEIDLSVGNITPRRPSEPTVRPAATISLGSD